MTEVYFPTCDQYVEWLQSGSGIHVYSGTIMQRGYGVGGLFRRLASGLLPLLPRIGIHCSRSGERQDERCTFIRGIKEAWFRSW